MDNGSEKKRKPKILAWLLKFVLILICIIVVISIVWIAFSLIGRVKATSVIPGSADVRVSVSNPARLFDRIMSHESLDEISAAPALVQAAPFLNMLKDNPLFKNRLVRLAARGNLELALLPDGEGAGTLVAALDLGFFSPLLRILPVVSGFVNIPNLYYVQAGSNSRFEFRAEGMTLFIGPYRNLLFITDNSAVYESRSVQSSDDAFVIINPSSYDAAFLLSGEFAGALLAGQDPGIAAVLNNVEFGSKVEAGLSVYPKKLEFRLAAPVSSRRSGLSLLLEQRSRAPGMAERIPADAQYATILSAGTLEELYQAALVFSPELSDTLAAAEISSRLIMGLTLNDLLFSWSGNEFAVFGMEGRPHPVYAIQIADERKRQEVFDRAFRSVALNEDVRLNLDGMRIPRIEIPEFLQSLMRKWDLFLPSPYYIIYGDFLFASESAQTLLSALRAMQRNNVLPGTDVWRDISGGKTTGASAASAFSLYYSLDLSVPFFLRKNTAVSGFLSLYRQGLARISFDRGVVDISLSLIPGSGNGITLASGYPLDTGGADRLSNRVYGAGNGENSRVFFTSGSSVISVNAADNSIRELSGQGSQWVIPAYGQAGRNANAWVVSDRGRVTLVDANLEPAQGFPALTGVRLSSPPAAYEGKLYLCGEDGRVHTVDENGGQGVWETSFAAAVRSPPSFLTVPVRNAGRGSGGHESGGVITYAAVYPKSFFGEIWLLDADGKALPNWPAPIAAGDDDDSVSSGIGFGSPLLFSHNDRVYAAFVNQVGQLLVYDENAAFVPPFPLSLNGIFYVQPVFDGEYLWLASSDGTFFRVSLDGEVLYQRIPGFSVMEEGYITVFDCNGDKVPEVFITGEGNALHAYTRGFRSLEGFPLPVWGRPLFVPAQGGRKAEIFGMGMDRRLYRWQFR
jgi:outer membrane protein assembly factor BamB